MEHVNTVTLFVVLGIAVRTDLQAHRIPNLLTGLAACAGLLLQATQAGMPGLLMSLAGIAVGVLFMLPFYALGGMGAGDVKLMGAIGSFLRTEDRIARRRRNAGLRCCVRCGATSRTGVRNPSHCRAQKRSFHMRSRSRADVSWVSFITVSSPRSRP